MWPLFVTCPFGVEALLANELRPMSDQPVEEARGGVRWRGDWSVVAGANLYSRLAQRVLLQVAHAPYRSEQEIYDAAHAVPWEEWFAVGQTFRVDVTAHRSPVKSLNFVGLRVKDGVADRFRQRLGQRPSVDTRAPAVRIAVHLEATHATLYLDTSGEPLFKRGWRQSTGDAPLKETLAAAMIAASGWDPGGEAPLYDPCCGSGTIAIEAAAMRLDLAPGRQRRFAFEVLKPHDRRLWQSLCAQAQDAASDRAKRVAEVSVFGSDVSHRMADFAQANARRAGVSQVLLVRAGDALQRMPPSQQPGVLLLNPPYGTRVQTAGVAGSTAVAPEFFPELGRHWKNHYAGWTAWVLSPDRGLPGQLRMRESRRMPLFNGDIECRLWRFDLSAWRAADAAASPAAPS
ncbi:MAG: THUMP domain-containing class I SAM-dependent RNA methyltransferase [Burkholderiaceae bacterium]